MTAPDSPSRSPTAAALEALARRPWALFGLCLLLNALARPYRGVSHDAVLYGAQALNRATGGHFDGDLFFRYGSQDSYSIFSHALAPLVGALGLPAAFFLAYLAAKALFLLGGVRLIFALIGRTPAAAAAALFLAADPVPFGGMDVLHANESFLTPRLIAGACVLWALAGLLHRRVAAALAWLAAGMLFHPLMAVGGAGVAVVWLARERLPARALPLLGAAAAAAGALVLAHGPTAVALFGTIDPEWKELVRRSTPYNFVPEWYAADFARIGLAAAVVAAFALRTPKRTAGRMAGAVVAVALLGLLGTALAGRLPYALLLQGQPHRALWLLQVVQVPAAAWLAVRLWKSESPAARTLAVGVPAAVGFRDWNGTTLLWLAALVPAWAVLCRGLAARPRSPRWRETALAGAVVSVVVLWTASLLAGLIRFRGEVEGVVSAHEWVWGLLGVPAPLVYLGTGVWLAGRLFRDRGAAGLSPAWTVPAALAVQAVSFAVPVSEPCRARYDRNWEDLTFVAAALPAGRGGAPPTVYWPVRSLPLLWFDLSAHSYFHPGQNAGNLFNRANAVETHRRAALVRP
ncbi:MAG TPA: hypothetical protein VIL46_16365, partial [Gemmataceae bacterium]